MSEEFIAEATLGEKNLKATIEPDQKIHPWRICPIGTHLVKEHALHVPPSKKHPEGLTVTRHQHCANNPSKKDLLTFEEIQQMSGQHFRDLIGPPSSGMLKFKNADKFDHLIRGWVHYWNDIFNPIDRLDPNLIKALIATESGFDTTAQNVIKKVHARGLMQIVEVTHTAIGNHKGELRNYLIQVSVNELFDPSVGICIGVRWLFRKKETASHKLHRDATWFEVVADYKDYLNKIIDGKEYNHKPLDDLLDYYSKLVE
ncbi:MAG: transglycosylase SLT domain-containing protein [Gammaproteobacteria bacterium]|nr:transglycosylase SLT domain-containing protein [Gammaproteobacteria bacterium]